MDKDKPRNPNYVYIDSIELKQTVAYHKKTGWLICSDKYDDDGTFVSYSPKELAILAKDGKPLTLATHRVKQTFHGEIVEDETDGKKIGKPAAGCDNASHTGGEVPNTSGNGKQNESEELEIY